MSHAAVDWAFKVSLPHLQKAVLNALAYRHNEATNRCDPSAERIAVDTGMSRSSVKVALRALEASGLIEVVRRNRGTLQLSNAFKLNMSAAEVGQDATGVGRTPTGGVGRDATGVGQDTTGGGAHGDPGVGRGATPKGEVKDHAPSDKERRAARGATDPRFTPFKQEFFRYTVETANGVEPLWDGREAKRLSDFLVGSPKITLHQRKVILQNRARSDIPQGASLSAWISHAREFFVSPLDRFGKPKATSIPTPVTRTGLQKVEEQLAAL